MYLCGCKMYYTWWQIKTKRCYRALIKRNNRWWKLGEWLWYWNKNSSLCRRLKHEHHNQTNPVRYLQIKNFIWRSWGIWEMQGEERNLRHGLIKPRCCTMSSSYWKGNLQNALNYGWPTLYIYIYIGPMISSIISFTFWKAIRGTENKNSFKILNHIIF